MPSAYYKARRDSILRQRNEVDALGNQEIMPALPPIDEETPELPPPDPSPNLLGKAIKTGVSMGFEGLRRLHQASKETFLYAFDRTNDFDTYKRRVSEAFKGRIQMSNREFGQIVLGKEKWEAMERTPWIPGWAPPLMEPEAGVIRKLKAGARFSLADLWSLGADQLTDPMTYAMLTPVGAVGKVGMMVEKVPVAGKLATFPFKAPTKFVDYMFSPRRSNPLAYAVNLVRQPEDVLPRPIFNALKNSADEWMTATNNTWSQAQTMFKHSVKYLSKTDQKVGRALVTGSTRGLNDAERQIFHNMNEFVQSHLDELVETNPGVLKELGFKEGHRLKLQDLYHYFGQSKSIPLDIWQSWRAENIGRIFLGLSKGQAAAKGLKAVEETADIGGFSAIELVRDTVFAVKKKQWFEPTLRKYAPRVTGRETEDILTSQMSKVQRRYYTDLANAFTGNARGRKLIEFDYMLLDFWQRVGNTPAGNRISKLFKKLGYGSKEGMPDFSTTSKIAGLWTNNIIHNILGLRLKSALVNSTQTLNFSISKGLPATIKGMMKMHGSLLGLNNPIYRQLRKEANLLGDYKALWTEDVWMRGVGRKWSEFLMGPFNAMENIIRGTGFHIGVDEFVKKSGKPLKAIINDPKLRKEMIQFAHLESSNAAFIYGTLGKAPVMSSPLLRPAVALLSFPYKQAEFLRREIVKDGGALLRFIGLHGWVIQRSNEWIGLASEDFLGWGFKPMTRSFGGIPLVTSPPVAFMLDSIEALGAVSEGDYKLAARKFDKVKESLPILFLPRFPWLQTREVFGDPMTGRKGLLDMWNERVKEMGPGQVPIAREEVILNFLAGRSTLQKRRSDLRSQQIKAIKKRDYIISERVGKWVEALEDHDGDKLGKATWELVQPFTLEGPEGSQQFYPDLDLINKRLDKLIEKKQISDDILAMYENQFLAQIFLQAQLELLHKSETGQWK